jgi:hypothetical protein
LSDTLGALLQRAATGHLTEDNARLITLLLSTPQYKSWYVHEREWLQYMAE